ncbi:MAG TPA: LamG domain-containing protein, partial [Planctomycetota bacterium]|nr:LamG domain-containing protein [Planctomycetota bacterium]
SVDVDDLTAACLRELLGKLPGRKPDADARIGALFPLLEGDPVDLSGLPPGALPPRIVSYASRVAEERARPDLATKEADARARFLTAERQFADAATRLQSFETFRALLASSADCTAVRRKRSLIAQRLEAEKDAGKEYVLYADQMQAAGAFRRVSQPKVASCWTSSADVPPEKENYLEFTFAARSAAEYRCWVYVGGCCTETFAFDVQGTEMGADPGSANRLPVKNSILFLKKTHAQHGGRKEPTRFEWVAVPLPKYASTGVKTVRLLSGQQGFSVAYAVVSAVRTAAPSDVQVKEWERSRPAVATTTAAAGSAADPSLVAWWTLDEGTGAAAADSSLNRVSGTLRGNPVWTSGKRRGALSFDGQKDYVEIPKNPKFYLPGPLTVTAWVNVAILPRSEWGMYLFSDYSSDGARSTFALRVMSSGAAQFLWQTEDAEPPVASSSGRLTPGTWAHLAGVWDGTARMLYVNGVLDGTAKGAQARPDIGGNVSIGRPGAYNGLYFSGRIDDVRIYNRALSTAEIRSLVGR